MLTGVLNWDFKPDAVPLEFEESKSILFFEWSKKNVKDRSKTFKLDELRVEELGNQINMSSYFYFIFLSILVNGKNFKSSIALLKFLIPNQMKYFKYSR